MNTSVRARHAERGFSFVELLVTVIIAGIAFAAMVPLFVQATQANAADKVRTTAVNIAQDRIEKMRQLDYDLIMADNFNLTANTATWLYAAEFGPTWTTSAGRVYDIGYTVDELTDAANKNLYKRVTVAVTWKGAASQPSIDGAAGVTLRTFIYQQYAGPQIVDLYLVSPVGGTVDMSTAPYAITWDAAAMGTLTIQLAAVLNPADDNVNVKYVTFTGYGAGSVPVLSEEVDARDTLYGVPARFGVSWLPATDGSADGIYRFETTAYSSVGGYAGNTYVEELRLESGPPPKPTGLHAGAGLTKVDLTWVGSPAADVVKYEVWRSSGADAPARVDGNLVTQPAFHDTNLSTGIAYTYYVVAVDGDGIDGNRSLDSPSVTVTTRASSDTTSPPTPAVTSVPTFRKAVLTWMDVADALVGTDPTSGIRGYWVYRDDGVKYLRASPKIPGQAVNWSEDITENHSYQVTSIDVDGNESVRSTTVTVAFTVPSHLMILSSNKRCDFVVRDSLGNTVGSKSNVLSYQLTLPEGTYHVTAKQGNQTQGPEVVEHDSDPENVPAFSF